MISSHNRTTHPRKYWKTPVQPPMHLHNELSSLLFFCRHLDINAATKTQTLKKSRDGRKPNWKPTSSKDTCPDPDDTGRCHHPYRNCATYEAPIVVLIGMMTVDGSRQSMRKHRTPLANHFPHHISRPIWHSLLKLGLLLLTTTQQ